MESIFSGLNNIETYDVFTDEVYVDDFGLTEEEIDCIYEKSRFDKTMMKNWYNGITIGGKPIYNIYSVVSFLQKNFYDNYWGRSGNLNIIVGLMNNERKQVVMKLLNGENHQTYISRRLSISDMRKNCDDSIFYSFLIQTGSKCRKNPNIT